MRRIPVAVALASIAGITACASAPSSAPAGPARTGAAAVLGYQLAGPVSGTYELADTSVVTIDAGGNQIRVDAGTRIGLVLDIAPAASGASATVRVTSVDGSTTNSMGPSVTIGTADIPGPAEVSVARNGAVTDVRRPQMTANFQRLVPVVELHRRFFLRLPDRAISRGATWTDTIPLVDQVQGMNLEATAITTSTWARDTTVGGRTLMVVVSRTQQTTRVHGNADGVEVDQRVAGTSDVTTLWDPQTRLVVERRETSSASGTTSLPAMGVSGLPTSLRGSTTLRLVSGGSR